LALAQRHALVHLLAPRHKTQPAPPTLFCDLRGFTGFTESADAEDVMALLRDYHAAICFHQVR
jgi:class 3 adenylate cyclase